MQMFNYYYACYGIINVQLSVNYIPLCAEKNRVKALNTCAQLTNTYDKVYLHMQHCKISKTLFYVSGISWRS